MARTFCLCCHRATGVLPRAARLTSLGAVLGMISSAVMAGGVTGFTAGPGLTWGGISHPATVQTSLNNPGAAGQVAGEGLWFGLGAVAIGYEVGDVDDLLERTEDLEDVLDRDFASLEEVQVVRDEFDDFLLAAGRNGYVKGGGTLQLPFTPVGGYWGTLGGTVSFEASGLASLGGRILDAPLEVTFDGNRYALETDTAAYLKQAVGYRLSLGYSREVFRNEDGALSVGSRVNYYKLDLSRAVTRLDEGDNQDDFGDRLEDGLEQNERGRSGMGLDVGALWTGAQYQLGGTLRNLNEPSFDYPRLDPAGNDRIPGSERYTMERQLQLEAAVFTRDQHWFAGVAYDVNGIEDAVGDEFRWMTVAGGYQGTGWWIPGVRAGYRRNLTGTELGYYLLGTTLFRVVNLDLAWSTDSVDMDGDTMPRSAMASLSTELRF